MIRGSVVVLMTLAAASSLAATNADAVNAKVEKSLRLLPEVIESNVFGEKLIPNWEPEGSRFWFSQDDEDGRRYVLVNAETRTITQLFREKMLADLVNSQVKGPVPPETFEVEDPELDFDELVFSFTVGERRWAYSVSDHSLQALNADTETPETVSPDGRWQVVTQDYDLYLKNVEDGTLRRVTNDGSKSNPYARPVVSLEQKVEQGNSEPEIEPQVYWAPDSARFATYRMHLAGARQLSAVQSSPKGGGPPRTFEYYYPMTGDEIVPTAEALVVETDSLKVRALNVPRQEILYSTGPVYTWTSDSRDVLQRIVARGYKSMELVATSADTGESRSLSTTTNKQFVDFYAHRWSYVDAVDSIFWISDESGWNQGQLIDRQGDRKLLMPGPWEVTGLAGRDENGQALYLTANGRESGQSIYNRHLYRVSLADATVELLTPEPVDHEVYVSPDGQYFVDNQSLVNRPTRTVLRSTNNGEIVIELQQANIDWMTEQDLRLPEPFSTVAADGQTEVNGVIYRPSDFRPTGNYPVVEYMYTGPHAITVPRSFADALKVDAAFSVAELGVIVVVVDGRGTSGRGKEFLSHSYNNLHAVGLEDHIAAIEFLAESYPYIDLSRVGVYGYSAGGYDVVRAMTERPDFYRVGVSASGNHDNRLDKAVWNEQWLGYPLGPQYEKNSNVAWADKLDGKLLLAHGELDGNVPIVATLRLVNALIRHGKSFDYMEFPNAGHYLASIEYFNRMRFEFFVRELNLSTN